MKTMSCKELGGECDTQLSAETWNEMVDKMTKHVMANHSDLAKRMEEMYKEDPHKWGRTYKPKWDAVPNKESTHKKSKE